MLGNHVIKQEGKKAVAVRAFLPEAAEAWVVDTWTKKLYPMEKIHKAGFFQAIFFDRKDVFPYRLRIESPEGTILEFCDPYSFLPYLPTLTSISSVKGAITRYTKSSAHTGWR